MRRSRCGLNLHGLVNDADRIALNGPWVPSQLQQAKQRARDYLSQVINDSASHFSAFFDEAQLQQALHDPISKILKENIPIQLLLI